MREAHKKPGYSPAVAVFPKATQLMRPDVSLRGRMHIAYL